jgi:hypothetical protein
MRLGQLAGEDMAVTKTKLDEARFFLQEMDVNCYQHPTFAYHLSAFISSARSVLWVMQHEFGAVPGWRAWYESKNPGSDVAEFLRGLNQLRVRTVKLGTPEVHYLVEFSIPKTSMTRDLETFLAGFHAGQQVKLSIQPGLEESRSTVTGKSASITCNLGEVFPTVQEFPDCSVLVICTRYLSWLSDLVCECETRFAA